MVSLYVESSAALAWLFGEDAGDEVAASLAVAEVALASTLTFAECERAVVRGVALGRWSEAEAQERRRLLAATTESWQGVALDEPILERVGRPFPVEPVRTLDAIHLASALAARAAVPGLAFLSLDRRCRANANALGFRVLPEPAGEIREPSAPPARRRRVSARSTGQRRRAS